MPRGLLLSLLLLPAPALAQGWSMVGVYDASALLASLPGEDDPASSYLWIAAPGMTRSCGPAKAPDGLGLFEAEAIANAMAPTLAILLEAPEGAGPLGTDDVRVSLGRGSPAFRLQPAVLPRAMAVSIGGPGELRHKQLVRTQLEMELCMEHKVGRGWIGGAAEALRQAFLLDPPTVGGPDRKAFGGQRDPVPALLGPPDACLRREEGLDSAVSGGKGEGSLDLVPSDVWGASLRWCEVEETGGSSAAALPRGVPLSLSEHEAPPRDRRRAALDVVVGAAAQDLDVTFDLTYDGRTLARQAALFSAVPAAEGEEPAAPGIQDLLASVPYTYPTLGPPEAPDRYALLLVPNWQIVEGLRRLERGELAHPIPDAGEGVIDGVGALLSHPELLFIQVPGEGERWVNLTGALTGEPAGLRSWGYNAGMLAGRKPVALPGEARPAWEQVVEAHRAGRHSLFLGAAGILLGIGLSGLRRLRDLWTPSPTERAAYWPGWSAPPDDKGAAPPKGLGK